MSAPTPQRNVLTRLWFNRESRAVISQIAIILALALLVAFIWNNTYQNLTKLGVSTGFGFLQQPANYDINQTLIAYTSKSTHFEAYLVGVLNTLLVAVVGCALATVVGFLAGVFRMSRNWLVSRLAYVYVEFTRNVPVLLQILLWYGLILQIPHVKQAIKLAPGFHLSNRGLVMPVPVPDAGFWVVPVALAAAVVAAIFFSRWAKRHQEVTGKRLPVISVILALIFGLPFLAYFAAGMPLSFAVPVLSGFNFRGGMTLRPEFIALTWALAVYTGSFIAEIVRSGIQSVSHGQSEAAFSLGIKRGVHCHHHGHLPGV